jgi:hypothetical protein
MEDSPQPKILTVNQLGIWDTPMEESQVLQGTYLDIGVPSASFGSINLLPHVLFRWSVAPISRGQPTYHLSVD